MAGDDPRHHAAIDAELPGLAGRHGRPHARWCSHWPGGERHALDPAPPPCIWARTPDAPCHHGLGAPGIDARPLDDYLGPAKVIAVQVERGGRFGPGDVALAIRGPRVLFRTGTYSRPVAVPRRFRRDGPSARGLAARAGGAAGGDRHAERRPVRRARPCPRTGSSSPTTWRSSRGSTCRACRRAGTS